MKEWKLDPFAGGMGYLFHQDKTLADNEYSFVMLQLHIMWIVLVSVVAELKRWITRTFSFGLIQNHLLDC